MKTIEKLVVNGVTCEMVDPFEKLHEEVRKALREYNLTTNSHVSVTLHERNIEGEKKEMAQISSLMTTY